MASRFLQENTEFAKSLLGQDDRLNIGGTDFGEDYLKDSYSVRYGIFNTKKVTYETWARRKFRQANQKEMRSILLRDPTERAREMSRMSPGTRQISSSPLTSSTLLGN